MKVIIERRHTINTTFASCTDCALARAIREQHPSLIKDLWFIVGGSEVRIGRNEYRFDNGKNSDFKSGWNSARFDELKSGIIDRYELEIPIPWYDALQTSVYDVDYFIKKFEAIPEEKWCINTRLDHHGNRCALGWCYQSDRDAEDSMTTIANIEETKLTYLFNGVLLERGVGWVNNGYSLKYQQPTPKQRVLAALYDIKSLQQPKDEFTPVTFIQIHKQLPALSNS